MICIFHKYGKWGKLIKCFFGFVQFRYCEKCGKADRRKVGSDHITDDKLK